HGTIIHDPSMNGIVPTVRDIHCVMKARDLGLLGLRAAVGGALLPTALRSCSAGSAARVSSGPARLLTASVLEKPAGEPCSRSGSARPAPVLRWMARRSWPLPCTSTRAFST